MSRFAILLAGPIRATPALRRAVAGRRVIAADGGIAHAAALGLCPELWVGDFDSAPAELPEALRGRDIPREAFPRDKAWTDGELAIEAAKARGGRDLLLVGALGGRSDHAFSHLVVALRETEADAGLAISLFDGVEHALPLRPGWTEVEAEPGAQFSLLKFSDLTGLTIEGARFPLDRVALPFASILTQSNEATGPVRLGLGSGRAILLLQADPARR
jgi:thiamine pyrophosphokinase